jgi:hypothetical protein
MYGRYVHSDLQIYPRDEPTRHRHSVTLVIDISWSTSTEKVQNTQFHGSDLTHIVDELSSYRRGAYYYSPTLISSLCYMSSNEDGTVSDREVGGAWSLREMGSTRVGGMGEGPAPQVETR